MTIAHNHTPRRPAPADGSLTRQLGLDPDGTHVFEFANGPDDPRVSITPMAPGVSVVRSRRQPIRVGHVAGNVTGADRIFTDGRVIPPEEAGFIDAECPDCDSELAVLPDQEPGVLWFVTEHRATCPAFAAWTRGQP